jgi:hypothetical protein
MYTLDNSLPYDFTDQLSEGPFEIEAEAEFVVKKVPFKRCMSESEVIVYLQRDENLKVPAPSEAQMERPKHLVSPLGVLTLTLGVSPQFSMYLSDDEELSSPYFSFPSDVNH